MPTVDTPRAYGEIKPTQAVSLNNLIAPYKFIDLVHMDVQGVEYDVLNAAFDAIQQKVGALVIGTHSEAIEHDLRQLLREDWECLFDYTLGSTQDTPYGRVNFGDGVQIWEDRCLLPQTDPLPNQR